MTLAQRERRALVETMRSAGPDAPTLCGEWTARDLAAHLVVRERRPDAAPGILLGPLSGYTAKVQARVVGTSFSTLLDQIYAGPPWWSPLRPIDAVANVTEMFVHHEDVRRAESGWQPRELATADADTLWALVRRMGWRSYRKAQTTVALATPDGRRAVVRSVSGSSVVTLTGPPAELLLHAFGRNEVRLETTGAPDEVRAVLDLDRSI
ncbi:TIGR03085 family metal-binding protein [Nocardia sp. CNY236]|uniref:TIGR03085 family metal-binding protein n=1 Tax=Nocardia sp. CNY236 TaxID=1169152 RepID=UPI0003FF17A3|nr:TIGR03085 family metal-binding protein [Nocardia sp. CNY236]